GSSEVGFGHDLEHYFTFGESESQVFVSVIISNIRIQFDYTPSYHKVWITEQKATKNMHNGWNKSNNDLWQWCQGIFKRG
ncbi:hypothetical protein J1N35_025494, partial [Gossypium stocksii]